MLESIGNDNASDTKLDLLIAQVEKQLRGDNSMKTRMLYQFLVEYQKARLAKRHKKPAVPRTPRPEPKRKVNNQPKQGAQTNVMTEGWGVSTKPSVLSARYAPVKGSRRADTSALVKGHFQAETVASAVRHKPKAPSPPTSSLWIGGSKHQEDFADESWTSFSKLK